MDLMAALAGITHALNIVKFVREEEGALGGAELKTKMADLTEALADAKLALVEARETIEQRDKEIERLRATFQRRDETVERAGYRYRKNESGEPIGLPFCPR